MLPFKSGWTGVLAIFVCLAIYQQVSAAQLVIENGELMGANNVTVNGTDYNVRFVEGSALSLYNTDGTWHLMFNSWSDALQAAQALDEVFVDTGDYSFDSDPLLTHGISETTVNEQPFAHEGYILVPYRVFTSGLSQYEKTYVQNAYFLNSAPVVSTDTAGGIKQFEVGVDMTDGGEYDWATIYVYTTWSLSGTPYINPVPVPASFLLLVTGLIGLAGFNRKIRQ